MIWTQVEQDNHWWETTKKSMEPDLEQPGWVNEADDAFVYHCKHGGFAVIVCDARKNISDTWAISKEAAQLEAEFLLDELEEEGGILNSIFRLFKFLRH